MSRLRELYAQKAAPAWSCLVETLNDPYLIAVVLFCLIGILVSAGRLRWNEWYAATHPDAVEWGRPFVTGVQGSVRGRILHVWEPGDGTR